MLTGILIFRDQTMLRRFTLKNIAVWLLIANATASQCPLSALIQQSLTYGAVPALSTYQLGRVLPISGLDTSQLQMGTDVQAQSPYTVTNNSASEARIILVKIETPLPEGCSIEIGMDASPGLSTSNAVSADKVDRGLVDTMQKGSYQGKMHFNIRGNITGVANNNITILYTLICH